MKSHIIKPLKKQPEFHGVSPAEAPPLNIYLLDVFSANQIHYVRVTRKGNRMFPIKTRTHEYNDWLKRVIKGIQYQMAASYHPGFDRLPVHLHILRGYRQHRQDIDNCIKPLGDALEAAGVMHNDRQVRSVQVYPAMQDYSTIKVWRA